MSKDLSLLNFLGPEFLTWLYFHLEERNGELKFSDYSGKNGKFEDSFLMCVGNRAVLRPLVGNAVSVSVVSVSLDDSGEVLQAFRAGALLDALSLEIHFAERVYTFSVNAKDGSISQFKIVQSFSNGEAASFDKINEENDTKEIEEEANLLLRMTALDETEQVLDALYATFLQRRLMPTFTAQELAKMRKSVHERLVAKLPPELSKKQDGESSSGSLNIWA